DRQGPQMPERRRSSHRLEVGTVEADQVPVRAVRERGGDVPTDRCDLMRPPDQEGGERDQEQAEQRRQEPARAPEPEPSEAEPAARDELRPQQRRDQESGENEEDFDAEEPAGGPQEVGVIQENRDDGDRSDAVESRDRRDVPAPAVGSRKS